MKARLADANAEAALLTCMLIRPTDYVTLISRISPADFSDPKHQAIWGAITHLLQTGRHVDAVTVASVLSERQELDGVGGMETLVRLQGTVASTRHGLDYAEVLLELSKRRRMDAAAVHLREALAENGSIESAMQALAAAAVGSGTSELRSADDVLAQVLDLFEHGETGLVSTTIPVLDEMLTGGFRPGQLVVVGARPGTGKSAFGLGVAALAAQSGQHALVVTLEMSELEVGMRLVARQTGIPVGGISAAARADAIAKAEWSSIEGAFAEIADLPMSFISGGTSVEQIRAHLVAEQLAGRRFDLVIVDYLQLLSPSSQRTESRQIDVSAISRGLKLMAQEMDVPVIALSQLNRAVETRADRRPVLADLRESGSIEQDADVVILIYRGDLYDRTDEPGVIELIVAKQRNGPTGTVRAVFLGEQVAIVPAA